MSKVDLRTVDLNLMIALEALLEECHVTNSATRLNLTQSAMSRSLAKLREVFDDPLLVRVDSGYQRTARAEAVLSQLKSALNEVRLTYEAPTFNPATATGEFRVATLDYPEIVILPVLSQIVRSKAPGLMINVVQKSILSIDEVVSGKADVSIGWMPSAMPKFCAAQKLFEDDYVCVMDRSHPLAGSTLSLDGYLSSPHAIMSTGRTAGSFVDNALSQVGLSRNIAKRSPHFVTGLLSIRHTDLLQTAPRRLALPLLKPAGLVMKELPFKIEPVVVSQLWHTRNNHSPVHKWFRSQIAKAVEASSVKA